MSVAQPLGLGSVRLPPPASFSDHRGDLSRVAYKPLSVAMRKGKLDIVPDSGRRRRRHSFHGPETFLG